MSVALRERLVRAEAEVHRGKSLSRAAANHDLFPEALSVYLTPEEEAQRPAATSPAFTVIAVILLLSTVVCLVWGVATYFALLQVVLFVGAGIWGCINHPAE